MQRTADQGIDQYNFKRYKIKRFGFLFKGMQGVPANKHGIILPMLIIQVQGYILGISSFFLIMANEMFAFLKDAVIVVVIIFFVHVCAITFTTIMTGIISKKRDHKKEKKQYSHFDRILEKYFNGKIKKMLLKYSEVKICTMVNKNIKTIQLNYRYHNIYVMITFSEDGYRVLTYHVGTSADDVAKHPIDYTYQDDFELEKLMKTIEKNYLLFR